MARLIAFFLCIFSVPALAAEPLKLTADNALEWHRDQQKIIAKGNVKASQGTASIESATMTATYEEGTKSNKFLPQTLYAETNVRIKTPDGTAYGDIATYDIKREVATLTGNNLRLESDNFKLTANQEFKYQVNQAQLLASGRAKLIQST